MSTAMTLRTRKRKVAFVNEAKGSKAKSSHSLKRKIPVETSVNAVTNLLANTSIDSATTNIQRKRSRVTVPDVSVERTCSRLNILEPATIQLMRELLDSDLFIRVKNANDHLDEIIPILLQQIERCRAEVVDSQPAHDWLDSYVT